MSERRLKMKRKLGDLDPEEFMKMSSTGKLKSSKKSKIMKQGLKKKGKPVVEKKKLKITEEGSNTNSESEEEVEDPTAHKASLKRLQEKDPEFFEYLKENDKELLEFDLSSTDDETEQTEKSLAKNDKKLLESDLSSSDDETELQEKSLEATSDNEDEFSEDEEMPEVKKELIKGIDLAAIKLWEKQLKSKPDVPLVYEVINTFKAAVEQAGDDDSKTSAFTIEADCFNKLMQISLRSLLPAIHTLLKVPPPSIASDDSKLQKLNQAKGWNKMKGGIRMYLISTIRLLNVISEPTIVNTILKHILHLVPHYALFPKVSRALFKKLVLLWCTSEETMRVLSFLCIIRIVRTLPPEYLDYILKLMYAAYVKNSKFTSPNTWPMINFMRRSLVELYNLDQNIAYQHAFVYIRQLSIHLRNAITTKKKENIQAVYNWQFVHCLKLWVHLLSALHPSPVLEPLVYPLVQTIIGTIKLVTTSKYLPLRFHLISDLIEFSRDTEVFIPILPFIIEVLHIVDFNKKATAVSMRPIEILCALKLSKSQLAENGFRDCIMDQIYRQFMECLHVYCHTIAFPELVLPLTVQLKKFTKECRVANYCRKMKQILEKVEQNSKVILERREKVNFGLKDRTAIKSWEAQQKTAGTPISDFYTTWKKVVDREIVESIAKKDKIEEKRLPVINRKELSEKKSQDKEEFGDLFASGSDSDEGDFVVFDPEEKKKLLEKRKKAAEIKKNAPEKKRKAPVQKEVEDEIVSPPKKKMFKEEYQGKGSDIVKDLELDSTDAEDSSAEEESEDD